MRMLALLADPNVAYILMLLGFYGILFELQNPGAILPGVVGGIALILAFFALSTLPVNSAGVALIVLGIVFFVAEIKVTSHGVLAAGGIIAMLLGSLLLVPRRHTGQLRCHCGRHGRHRRVLPVDRRRRDPGSAREGADRCAGDDRPAGRGDRAGRPDGAGADRRRAVERA
jgi:hypothetical protein